jgi:uncharacterized surface protein with fasciclin (FAS1) repeats
MKRESSYNWLFWIVVLCFTTSVISQEKEIPQTSESSINEEKVIQTLTISKYLQFNEEYSTFVKVLKESDVFSHLESDKKFTVFAPGNSAFAQMPANVIDELFRKENHVKLKSIAEYHIVNSILNLNEELFKLNGSTNIVAMNNEIIQITVGAEDRILIQDANNYPIDVMEKIELSNGIIYRIDAVLLPQVDVRMVLR